MFNKIAMFAFGSLALALAPAAAATTNPRVDTSGVNAQPPYPASALPDRESGAVLLAVGVDPSGNVTRVRPVRTSGFDDLDAAAINGAMKWKFVPATDNGKAVEGTTLIQIVFQPPTDGSTQPDKPGVATDYLPQTFTLEGALGKVEDRYKTIPCANGSVFVTMQFERSNAISNRDGEDNDILAVDIGAPDNAAVLRMYPPFYPPEYLQLSLVGVVGAVGNFDQRASFKSPVSIKLTWTDYGLVTATAFNGEKHQIHLPVPPTRVGFHASSAVGIFKDAQIVCTPNGTN